MKKKFLIFGLTFFCALSVAPLSYAQPDYGDVCPSDTQPFVKKALKACASPTSEEDETRKQQCQDGLDFMKERPAYYCAVEQGIAGKIIRIYTSQSGGYIHELLYLEFDANKISEIRIHTRNY